MNNKKILIVDDDLLITQTLKNILQWDGYETIVARDGEEGFIKAREETPDLIILDLLLPKLSGEELCKKIRRDKDISKIPIIMLTAKNTETDRIIGKVIGASVYMCKPFDINELLQKVKQFLYGQSK
jgi:two-component system alkaline phosphatase synthesis response regulator PhoP